jgi:hypothetical protein
VTAPRRRCLRALPAVATLAVTPLLAGCSDETTDVSAGVNEINSKLPRGSGARLDCPKEVDGGKGTKFDCTLLSSKTGKKRRVEMQITEEGGQLRVSLDAKTFNRALRAVIAK